MCHVHQQAHISNRNSVTYINPPIFIHQYFIYTYCKQLTLLCTSCSQKVHSPRMRQTCVNHVSNICIPQKCNETMVLYNVYFARFYVIYATFSPFGNMRFVTKLKCFLANLRCFRDFQLGTLWNHPSRTFVPLAFFSILRRFHNKSPFGNMRFFCFIRIALNLSITSFNRRAKTNLTSFHFSKFLYLLRQIENCPKPFIYRLT